MLSVRPASVRCASGQAERPLDRGRVYLLQDLGFGLGSTVLTKQQPLTFFLGLPTR